MLALVIHCKGLKKNLMQIDIHNVHIKLMDVI